MARKCKNFIDAFLKYSEGKGSPELYRLWTALFIVGAVCERKVWLATAKGRLYPNQYILLVGGAGIGKSLCTTIAYDLIDATRTPENPLFIAPVSLTKASLIDALNEAERRIVKPMEVPAVTQFNSLIIIPNEFGVFLPTWDGEFMSTLTDIWDNGRYSEMRRTSKINIHMPNTQLNMLSATTPIYLTQLLPEGAWEQGFMSRTMVIYSGEYIYTDIFDELNGNEELRSELIHDLREIYSLWGSIGITEEAQDAFRAWAKSGGAPAPDHPKLSFYNSRRGQHLLKLCLIASVADNSDKMITIDHFAEALDWLVRTETNIPDVFKSMKAGGDLRAIEDCWHFTYQIWMKDKAIIPEHRIIAFLQERVPAHNIQRLLEVMCLSKLLEKKFMDNGSQGYEPMARRAQ